MDIPFFSKNKKNTDKKISDKNQLTAAIAELGKMQRAIDAIEGEYNETIAPLLREKSEKIAPLTDAKKALMKVITEYAEANKQALLAEARENSGNEEIKTLNLGTGEISWRLSTPRVEFPMGEARAAQELMEKGLANYVVIGYEIPKDAVRMNFAALIEAGIEQIKVTQVKDKVTVTPYFQELT